MPPVVRDEPVVSKPVMLDELLWCQTAGCAPVNSSEKERRVDFVELAMQTQFSEEAQVRPDEGAKQRHRAQSLDTHDSVLRVTVSESFPQPLQSLGWQILHEVQR